MKKTKSASQELSLTPTKPAGQMRRTQITEPDLPTGVDEASLIADLRALIQSARQRVAIVLKLKSFQPALDGQMKGAVRFNTMIMENLGEVTMA